MYLYKCRRAATLCGSCVGFATVQYKCGWCVNTSSCSVNDSCPAGQWVGPAGECLGKPIIESVRNFDFSIIMMLICDSTDSSHDLNLAAPPPSRHLVLGGSFIVLHVCIYEFCKLTLGKIKIMWNEIKIGMK